MFKRENAALKTIERLEDSLWELTKRVESLESTSKTLGLEWEELYDKVRRQMARMSKRSAVDAKENLDPSPPEAGNSHYSHLDPISQSIMLRRAGQGTQK